MSDDTKAEQAAWQDLVQSPGWDRLVAHAKEEWEGPTFLAQVERLADNPEDPVALSKLRQLLSAKRAVLRLLSVPEEAVGKVKRRADYDPRLGLDLEDITMRRGRL